MKQAYNAVLFTCQYKASCLFEENAMQWINSSIRSSYWKKKPSGSAEAAKCKLTHLEYVALVQQRTEGGIVAKVPVQLTAGTLKAEPIEPEILQISNSLDTVLS